jgi:hypothetical protein
MVVGGIVASIFLLLPMLAPDNGLSRAMFTPLFCTGNEIYRSEAVRGTSFSRSPTLSPRGYCETPGGARREVTSTQVTLGMIFGGAPFLVGLTLYFLIRSLRSFMGYWAMGMELQAARVRNQPSPHSGVYGAKVTTRPREEREE